MTVISVEHRPRGVEQVFASLYSWMHVIMEPVGLHENLNTSLWPKWAETVTKLETFMVIPNKEKCAHENFYYEMPDYAKHLNTFEKWELYAVLLQ